MKRKLISWVLVVLWMILIFYLSHQPSTESNKLSIGITEKITIIVEKAAPIIDTNIRNFNRIIRKNAHFFAYLILGFLTFNVLKDSEITGGRGFILALIICILYAISDEIHQLFIPGRSGQVMDVVIDGMGSLAGITLQHQISSKIKGN
ncbi:VanZ family protein [Tissierella pigra]|uniref:VanZ family protein n=1 Tax=Tissierella pigra TaxID=2607614 RepID=A0A6N7XJ60_9FIRM|nr:VanZ family protein [Tissierella pigra]MSU02121.1 VanZ family protein [Tissierella pigra]